MRTTTDAASVTVPSVGLCAVIGSDLLVPAGSANDRGAVHVNTDGPYCLGGAGVVGGSVTETLMRGVAGARSSWVARRAQVWS